MGDVASLVSANAVSIRHTDRAFAVLKGDGSVVVWGSAQYGGTVSASVANYLTSEVRLLCANSVLFTAVKNDGSVIAWGNVLAVTPGLQSSYKNMSGVNSCE